MTFTRVAPARVTLLAVSGQKNVSRSECEGQIVMFLRRVKHHSAVSMASLVMTGVILMCITLAQLSLIPI